MSGTSLVCVEEGPTQPIIKIKVHSVEAEALIDSGATISVISYNLYQKLIDSKIVFSEIKNAQPRIVKAVNGQVLKTSSFIEINLSLGSYYFSQKFVVVYDVLCEMILGQDFLFNNDVVVDFGKKALLFSDTAIGFVNTSKPIETFVQPQISKIDYVFFVNSPESLNENLHDSLNDCIKSIDDIKTLNVSESLCDDDRSKLFGLLGSYRKQFAFSSNELGSCSLVEVEVSTTDEIPIHKAPYRVSHEQHKIIRKQVNKMLANGIIRESRSAYASPVVLVRKPDFDWRFCIDFRALNKKVVTDSYPLPRIDDLILYLARAKFFADLDLNSGYWQLAIKESDKHKTAFVTPSGLYEFNVLPFGLKTSGAIFQRTMDKVLGGLKYKNAIVYIDNILVYGETFDEFTKALDEVLSRIRDANLTLKPSKCKFGFNKVSVLGYEISGDGIRPDASKIDKIKSINVPVNCKQLKSILGLFSYYRKFINNFAALALPLTSLLKKGVKFVWGDAQQTVFDKIMTYIQNPPLLRHFSNDKDITTRLFVDASDYALGACLMQGNESLLPVAFASRKLSDCESRYSITEKECLALIWALNYFKHLLWGMRFDVVTDHKALVWLRQKKEMSGRLARWSLAIQQYDFDIVYCSGRENVIADFLSRNPLLDEIDQTVKPRVDNANVDDGLEVYRIESVEFGAEQIVDGFCSRVMTRLARLPRHNYRGFYVRDGLLYNRCKRGSVFIDRLVVPERLFDVVMREVHDDPWLGAHFGLAKTLGKFRDRYFIPNADKRISKYVGSCVVCQERKRVDLVAPLQPISVNRLFERVAVDVLGPFTRSAAGNRYVVVCMEYLSKYAICKAVPRATAAVICDFLTQEVFCKFGSVDEILTDRGSIFTSHMVKETIEFFDARLVVAATRHPQTIGLVERFNRTLLQSLAMYTEREQNTWCSYVPMVTFAYNVSKQSSTTVSPYVIIFAREPIFRSDVSLNINTLRDDLNIESRKSFRVSCVNKAIRNIRKSQDSQKSYYDKRVRFVTFEPGRLVLVYNPKRVTKISSKLSRPYKGPYRIVRRLANNYLVEKVGHRYGNLHRYSRRFIFHHNSLKPFSLRL